MSIAVRKISKNFGSFAALDAVDLDIPRGRLVALLGPSGSGKTTLLRIIAGLESADSGSVQFDGEDFSSRSVRERRVGFVFQHYALFRHMTVFENVAFGLRVRPARHAPFAAAHPRARQRAARTHSAAEPGPTIPLAALRWTAATRRVGACTSGGAERFTLGRAFRCARCQGASRAPPLATPTAR